MRGPCIHEIAPLFEDIRSPVGPFDRAADLVAHRLLDDGVGNRLDFFGPSPERRPEAMGSDRSAAGWINTFGLSTRVHSLQEPR